MDYFTLLGMPNRFDIDKQQLATRYQDMQRQYHPDRFAGQSEKKNRPSNLACFNHQSGLSDLKKSTQELNTCSHYTVSILLMSNKRCTILLFF